MEQQNQTPQDDLTELPLFPLNLVLFPGMELPLHIFEERYKAMIGDCIQREALFGIVLIKEGPEDYFDMAFIDANKKDYDHYYERVLTLIRPGGLIVIDNVFWGGRVLDNNNHEKSTSSIRKLNKKILHDPRVSLSMLPLNDGVTLVWKRP